MEIHVEWTCGIIRLLEGEYGSPYAWCATAIRDGPVLTIKGVTSMPANPHRVKSALRAWCKANDITTVRWERYGKRHENHSV